MVDPNSFPKELDGARVIYAADEVQKSVLYYKDKGKEVPIIACAIAQYDDDSKIFVFSLDREYNVVGDYCFDSIDEAKIQIERNAGIKVKDWIPIT